MIRLEKLLKNGKLHRLRSKPILSRLKHGVENAARPIFGGIELSDLAFSFPISFSYIVGFVFLFGFLLSTNLQGTINAKVLGLNKDASGMTCVPIPKVLNGLFNADLDGNWETEDDYSDNKSLFVLRAQGRKISGEQFKSSMNQFRNEFTSFSRRASNRTMAWNLAVLSSFTSHHHETGLEFFLSVDASYFYESITKVATLSNMNGICLGYSADPAAGYPNGKYLSGGFVADHAALTLELPLRINPTSVLGSNRSRFSVTFTPTVTEPCPKHGKWFKHLFIGGDSEFRNGKADIGFDVRSTLLAISLNLGLVGTETLVSKVTEMTRSCGVIGLVDPYYSFPHMSRIYCINKTSDQWKSQFSEDERMEQQLNFDPVYRTLNPTFKANKYPNICFLTAASKGNIVQFFYPIISMLKWDRNPCWSEKPPQGKTSACPENTPFRYSPLMKDCECPQDRKNQDCNRQSLFTSHFYDTNFPMFMSNSTGYIPTPDRIRDDKAVKLGIAVQKRMVQWKDSSDKNYDLKALKLFDDIIAATVSVFNNPAAADIPFDSTKNPQLTPNNALLQSWQKLFSEVYLNELASAPPGKLAPISAIVFRSVATIGFR